MPPEHRLHGRRRAGRRQPPSPMRPARAHEPTSSAPPLLECESIPHPSPPLDSPGQEEGPHTGPTPRASPSLLPTLTAAPGYNIGADKETTDPPATPSAR